MSFLIIKKILTDQQKTEIANKLNIANMTLYNVSGGFASMPLSFGLNLCKNLTFHLEERESIICNIELRREQEEIFNKILETVARARTAILSLPTGFGKTILAIAAAAKFGLKTLIIVHRTNIAAQWARAINEFCPGAGVEMLGGRGKIAGAGDSMFFIGGPRVIRARLDFIKFLIVDEVHLIMTKSYVSCFEHIFPIYALALSATPYRNDETGTFINIFFGNEYISLPSNRKHVVHKISFKVKYEMKTIGGAGGKSRLDWNFILKQQCESVARNNMIIDIIEKNAGAGANFIILCKRKMHITLLYNLLRERGIDAYMFCGSDKMYENNTRVLLTTVSKCGVGFDDPRLNSMIIAADVENYFIQYLGRVFRSLDICPVIYDIVDTNYVLEKHWKTRKDIYEKSGGKIVNV